MTHVLIVEDSGVTRGRMRDVLTIRGYRVREAANGREALAALDQFTPDCILLDLMMPVMGGLDFLRRLKRRRQRPPVVVLHTDFPESTREACRAAGATDFVLKPFDEGELAAAVRGVVGAGAIAPK